MFFKIATICAAFACFSVSAILVRGEVASPSASPPNILESFQKHMQQFQNCLDQVIAKSVDEVNVKQVQPVFQVVGDQLNRFSKAFEDLTATKSPV